MTKSKKPRKPGVRWCDIFCDPNTVGSPVYRVLLALLADYTKTPHTRGDIAKPKARLTQAQLVTIYAVLAEVATYTLSMHAKMQRRLKAR